MNEPGAPPPDWGSIFHRARRRIAGRLMLVGAIAATGAILLLGGGLSAQGTVSWRIIGNNDEAKTDTTQSGTGGKSHSGKGSRDDKGSNKANTSKGGKSGNEGHDKKPSKPNKHHPHWRPCAGDSAEVQYCDSPDEDPTDGESTEATKTTSEGDRQTTTSEDATTNPAG